MIAGLSRRWIRFIVFVLVALVVGSGSVYMSVRAAGAIQQDEIPAPLLFEHTLVRVLPAQGGDPIVFDAEVARSIEQKARGLMYRDHLPRGTGMLFFLGAPNRTSFWMKNTRIPLDLLFVREDGVIESIAAMAKPYDLASLSSVGPVSTVLEIGGGEAARLKIKPGDFLHFVVN